MEAFKKSTFGNEAALEVKLGLTTLLDRIALRARRPDLDAMFRDVETFCVFVGYPRSGHSIVGSVIDAHPDAVVAHRLNAMRFLERGFAVADVLFLMHRNAQRFSRAGRSLTGYSYPIPGLWQGRVGTLRLIGDQEGKKNAQTLHAHPALIDRLGSLGKISTRFVHVLRNPYDNITTMSLRAYSSLESTIGIYFSLCEAVAGIRRRVGPAELIDVRHEDFVARPAESLRRLTGFLGLSATDAYVGGCAEAIYRAPHQSRWRAAWTPELVDEVRRRAERYDFLEGYRYEEA